MVGIGTAVAGAARVLITIGLLLSNCRAAVDWVLPVSSLAVKG